MLHPVPNMEHVEHLERWVADIRRSLQLVRGVIAETSTAELDESVSWLRPAEYALRAWLEGAEIALAPFRKLKDEQNN